MARPFSILKLTALFLVSFSLAGAQATSSSLSSLSSCLPLLSLNQNYQGPFEEGLEGWNRKTAKLYLPNNYQEKEAWPLVVLLHGFTGTAEKQDAYLTMRFRTTQKGFILLTPEGTANSDKNQFWNATDFCCDKDKSNVDDVGYLLGLIQSVQKKYKIDSKRIYLFGHSNGGFMANRLSCEAGSVFAGIANLAGGHFKDPAKCKSQDPVSYLQIHAENDDVIWYGNHKDYAGGTESVSHWLKRNSCSNESEMKQKKDFLFHVPGNDTEPQAWNNCQQGSRVELWKFPAHQAENYKPHTPLFNCNFSDAVLDFLLSQRN